MEVSILCFVFSDTAFLLVGAIMVPIVVYYAPHDHYGSQIHLIYMHTNSRFLFKYSMHNFIRILAY